MPKIIAVRIDPAKTVSQGHAADGGERAGLRKGLRRDRVSAFAARCCMHRCHGGLWGSHVRARKTAQGPRGPLLATAIAASALPSDTFRRGSKVAGLAGRKTVTQAAAAASSGCRHPARRPKAARCIRRHALPDQQRMNGPLTKGRTPGLAPSLMRDEREKQPGTTGDTEDVQLVLRTS